MKKVLLLVLYTTLLCLLFIDPVFAEEGAKVEFVAKTGCNLLSTNLTEFLQTVLDYIRIIGITLAIVLQVVDYVKVVYGFKDDASSKANKRLGVRLISIGLLFLVPSIVTFIITLANINNYGTCNIY